MTDNRDPIKDSVARLQDELARVDGERARILGALRALTGKRADHRAHRSRHWKMTAEQKHAVSERMKRYWAEWRKRNGRTPRR
jgi:hypothetical protein